MLDAASLIDLNFPHGVLTARVLFLAIFLYHSFFLSTDDLAPEKRTA